MDRKTVLASDLIVADESPNSNPPQPSPLPSITAIVPARNEETVIASCVESLAQQPEIAEILVVNDQSTDKTAEIIRSLMLKIPNLRLLETHEVPPGWVGKNNAVYLGAKQAKTPWFLFTDADAELQPGAAARALQIAAERAPHSFPFRRSKSSKRGTKNRSFPSSTFVSPNIFLTTP